MTDQKDAEKRLLEVEKDLEGMARSGSAVTAAGAKALQPKVAEFRSAFETAGKTEPARQELVNKLDALVPPTATVGRLAVLFGEKRGALGIVAVGIVLLVVVILIARMGVDAWKTIEGGRAILLIALTAAFITFGGALTLAPL